MEKSLVATVSLLTLLLQIAARGYIEFEISTTHPVGVQVTACPVTGCIAHNIQAAERIVLPDAPCKFREADYATRPLKNLDVWILVKNLTTHEVLGEDNFSPRTTTKWTFENISTDNEVELEVKFRNVCDRDFYGEQCERRCMPNYKMHWGCSKNGFKVCHEGWRGFNCHEPICNCSDHGTCTAPNVCSCNSGYKGEYCQICIPLSGCVKGGCAHNQPFTCACDLGFTGKLCMTDLNICKKEGICQNGGTCQISEYANTGYKCDCLPGFSGKNCENQTKVNLCKKGFTCLHGGLCITTDRTYCLCPERFSGTHCEYEKHTDCTTKKCVPGKSCTMVGIHPVCTTTPDTPDTPDDNRYFVIVALVFLLILSAITIYYIRKLIKHINRATNSYDLASVRYIPNNPPAPMTPLLDHDLYSTISRMSRILTSPENISGLLAPPPYFSQIPENPPASLPDNPLPICTAQEETAMQIEMTETNETIEDCNTTEEPFQ